MTSDEVLKILEEAGAILTGHFVLKDNKHSNTYINKYVVVAHPQILSRLCLQVATIVADVGIKAVVAPTVAGVAMSQWVAHHLEQITGRPVLALYADETQDTRRVLRHGFDKLVRGKQVLVVDDTTTTGGTLTKVARAVKDCGGQAKAAAVLVNRGNVDYRDIRVDFLIWLAFVDLPSWPEEECPLCKQGVPINTEVGHGREFLARKAKESNL